MTNVADLIDTVAIDNVVNRVEKAAGVTLSGTAEGADFVFVEWGGVEKIASVQDGIWSAYYPTVLNVTIDLGDFQSFSFSEVTLAEVFAAFPEFTFDDAREACYAHGLISHALHCVLKSLSMEIMESSPFEP